MTVFVDTSALLALLSEGDAQHAEAAAAWRRGIEEDCDFVTSNYVILELLALVGRRFGADLVREVSRTLLPALRLLWVDESVHDLALTSLLAASRRRLSLVDCASFALMRGEGIERAFAYDRHFQEVGFRPFT